MKENEKDKIKFLENNKLTEVSFDIDKYQTLDKITYNFYYEEKGSTPTLLGSVTLKRENNSYPEKVTLSNLNISVKPYIDEYTSPAVNWRSRICISSPDASSISLNASEPYYNYPDNPAGAKGWCIVYESDYNSCTAFQATGVLKFKGSG